MKKLFLLMVIAFFGVGIVLGYAYVDYSAPGTLSAQTNVIIRKGMRSRDTARALQEAGIIRHADIFYAINAATGDARKFKAGEYAFPPGISPKDAAAKLVAGDVVVHRITIPEGWSVREIKELLLADPVLEGDITTPIPEGSILPQTYYYTYGDTRAVVISRMQEAMQDVLAGAWKNRAANYPLTQSEALVLASIVEKETGVPEERARIAAVFLNRLKLGMRLQTDPTVIYGIEQQTGKPMGRALTYDDLETPHNYNTYVISGLPPTPIANPGAEAIEATLNPELSDDLYFVATGTGGHRFAKTLEEHNRNVAAYRAALANAAR